MDEAKTTQELLDEIEELRKTVKDQETEIADLKYDLRLCEGELVDSRDEESRLEDDVYRMNQITEKIPDLSALVDKIKFDLFCERFDRFTLEELENFLNVTNNNSVNFKTTYR